MINKSPKEHHERKQPPAITKFQDSNYRRSTTTGIPSTSKYQNIFFGICYSCNNFGHKAINCRAYVRGRNTWNINGYENFKNHDEKPYKEFDRSYNKFGALNYETEGYKCNNIGHSQKMHKWINSVIKGN